jgi:regulator of cell morphogenesis and NO signaling
MRELTGGYEPPADACNTYRAMLDGLAELERDTHLHIHEENNVLFPKVRAAETSAGS